MTTFWGSKIFVDKLIKTSWGLKNFWNLLMETFLGLNIFWGLIMKKYIESVFFLENFWCILICGTLCPTRYVRNYFDLWKDGGTVRICLCDNRTPVSTKTGDDRGNWALAVAFRGTPLTRRVKFNPLATGRALKPMSSNFQLFLPVLLPV